MNSALVIDDHPVTHLGCGQLLRELGYVDIRKAETEAEALRQVAARAPDLIVLDLGLPGMGGLNLIQPLRQRAPDARLLIFSMNEQRVFVARALEAGANGYLSKNSAPEDFLEAVRRIEAGGIYLSQDMALDLAARRIGGEADPLARLTPREYQVLKLIGRGEDLQAIADALRVSYKTAANTSASIKRKIGVRSTNALIRYALDAGLLE